VRGRLRSVAEAELRQDARDVVLGCSPADVEPLRDLGVRASFGQERQDLGLALRQRPVALREAPRGGSELSEYGRRSVGVPGCAETLEDLQRVLRLFDRCRGRGRGECPGERDPGLRGFESQAELGEELEGRLEVRPRLLVSSSGSDRSPGELGDGARAVVIAVARKHGQLVERFLRGDEVAECELHLDEQGEHGRAIRIGRRRALEAQAAEVPRKSKVAARQSDPRE
jgi:hypothetical protein